MAALPTDVPRARVIADTYWGGEPCGGLVDIGWAPLYPSVNATAAWTDIDGKPADFTHCSVVFTTMLDWTWPKFCTVFVHEFGHLHLGGIYFQATNPSDPSHSPDPASVMYAEYMAPITPCVDPVVRARHRHRRHRGHKHLRRGRGSDRRHRPRS